MTTELNSILQKYYKKFSANKYIVKFSKFTDAKNLWIFNQESIAKGVALGIACSWIPLPLHTTIAVFLAILIDCNIPLVALAIWFANPITMPFMYYFAYEVGDAVLHSHALSLHLHFDARTLFEILHQIWQPFLLGCLICGLASGLFVYTCAQLTGVIMRLCMR